MKTHEIPKKGEWIKWIKWKWHQKVLSEIKIEIKLFGGRCWLLAVARGLDVKWNVYKSLFLSFSYCIFKLWMYSTLNVFDEQARVVTKAFITFNLNWCRAFYADCHTINNIRVPIVVASRIRISKQKTKRKRKRKKKIKCPSRCVGKIASVACVAAWIQREILCFVRVCVDVSGKKWHCTIDLWFYVLAKRPTLPCVPKSIVAFSYCNSKIDAYSW